MPNEYPTRIGNCPYCLTAIMDSDDCLYCPGCEVPHHKECWQQNGGCTTFACEGKAAANRRFVDKDYDFLDLIEEYPSNKIDISLEDLLDESITEVDKDLEQNRITFSNNRNSSPSSKRLGQLIWILIFCIGLIIWIFSLSQ